MARFSQLFKGLVSHPKGSRSYILHGVGSQGRDRLVPSPLTLKMSIEEREWGRTVQVRADRFLNYDSSCGMERKAGVERGFGMELTSLT